MKKIITLIVALFMIVAVNQAQTLHGLFEKYSNNERFEYVSVGKGMMNMASALGGITRNDKEMMSKMRSIKILTLESNSDSPLMKTFERDLNQVIDNGEFETAVETRSKGEQVHIYYRVGGNDNADMLIITKERGELSIIWFSGKMTRAEMMNSFSSNERTNQINDNAYSRKDTIS